VENSSCILFLFTFCVIQWYPRQLFAFRRQQATSASVFLSSTKEWRSIPALLLITTDLGAPWILNTKETGDIAKYIIS